MSLPSSPFLVAWMAVGYSGSGIAHGVMTAGFAGSESVSPVSALDSRATVTISPASAWSTGTCDPPMGRPRAPTRSSSS